MQRYFATKNNDKIILDGGDVHHLLHVMRARKGDQIEAVCDGKLYIGEISNVDPLDIKIIKNVPLDSEIPNDVTLFFALSKGDKIEFVLQKATELGVKKIVLFKCKRCVVKFEKDDFDRKLVRYQKIVKEASEQSHRLIVPEIIGVVDITNIPNDLYCDVNFVAFEKNAGDTSNSFASLDNTSSYSVMVGPEGGFEDSEIASLESKGFKTISLGKRILRCETAAVYALSVLGFLLEK